MTLKKYCSILTVTFLLCFLVYWLSESVFYIPDSILYYLVLGVGIFLALCTIFLFIEISIRKSFEKKYNIKNISWQLKIRHKKKAVVQNHYELSYPYWYFRKKDGTADLRHKQNSICWQDSVLMVENYSVSSKRPYYILAIVKELRDKGIYISPCREELQKYDSIKAQKQFCTNSHSIQDIINHYSVKPTEFETFCAELFCKMGYTATVTPPANDGGYDIWLEQNGNTAIVECKCYNSAHSVGRPLIQKLVGANSVLSADRMIFVTTSNFSSGAVEYAKESGVELVDGVSLLVLLKHYGLLSGKKAVIYPSEWQLQKEDLKPYVPSDIYAEYFQ